MNNATQQQLDQAHAIGYSAGTFLAHILMIALVLAIVLAFICASMAARRGRSRFGGFISGLLFGLLAVVYYLIAGDTVEYRVYKEEQVRSRIRAQEDEDD